MVKSCLFGFFCAWGLLLSSAGAVAEPGLKIAVAANFKPLLKQLAAQFEQQYPITLSLSSASTGVLYAQIRHGAPFDVFLAADEKHPVLLTEQRLALAPSRHTYAIGRLVLWRNRSAAKPDRELLTGWDKKIALANVKTAPYGQAAKSVLQHLTLWQQKKSQLISGSNIAQTRQFIDSGNVELGFVALAQVKAQPQQQYWLLPTLWYPQLNQQAVILKRSRQPAAAKTFVNWLLSVKIQQQIVAAGYLSAL